MQKTTAQNETQPSQRHSFLVERCQICNATQMERILFLGYLPPVNTMPALGIRPDEELAFPAELLQCKTCSLVQIGLVVDAHILFPPTYPYTSGTTKILCENFAEMQREVESCYAIPKTGLVVDIGSNDGTLLSNFQKAGHPVLGIEPTNAGQLALKAGIPTIIRFFNKTSVTEALERSGQAQVITATNVFAHIANVHEVVQNILSLLSKDGIFISESHYWPSLVETLQYDTIYHEHLRYYSLTSLKNLLEMNGLEIIRAKKIPTHGGSVRVYAARKGTHPVDPSVNALLAEEVISTSKEKVAEFKKRVVQSKLDLLGLLRDIKAKGEKVYGIGAPSRASTLISYVGLDSDTLDCVLEVKGSHKVGKYIPGTLIPVQEEGRLFTDQPEYALLLSWHIADELMPKLIAKGFRGKFIVPLPTPRVIDLHSN